MRFAPLALLVALALPASAQMLPSGTWTGTWTDSQARHELTADIERCSTGFRVGLAADGRTASTETATWTEGQLRFTTRRARMPGMIVPRALACTLGRTDGGGLAGACVAGRSRYRVALAPPADGAFGCSD